MLKLFRDSGLLLGLLLSVFLTAYAATTPDLTLLQQQVAIQRTNNALVKAQAEQFQQELSGWFLKFDINGVSDIDLRRAELLVARAKTTLDASKIAYTDVLQAVRDAQNLVDTLKESRQNLALLTNDQAREIQITLAEIDEKLANARTRLDLEKQLQEALRESQQLATEQLTHLSQWQQQIDALAQQKLVKQRMEKISQSVTQLEQARSQSMTKLVAINTELQQLGLVTPETIKVYQTLQFQRLLIEEQVSLSRLALYHLRLEEHLESYAQLTKSEWSVTRYNEALRDLANVADSSDRIRALISSKLQYLQDRITAMRAEPKTFNIAREQLQSQIVELKKLELAYQNQAQQNSQLIQNANQYADAIKQQLRQQLSMRQALPDFSVSNFVALSQKAAAIPALLAQSARSLLSQSRLAVVQFSQEILYLFVFSIALLCSVWLFIRYFITRISTKFRDKRTRFSSNVVYIITECLRRILTEIFALAALLLINLFTGINATLFVYLILVYLAVRVAINLSRLILLDNTAHAFGEDVRLYHRLKWTFLLSGLVALLAVLVAQLPVDFEIKAVFNRIFMVFMLLISIVLLRVCMVVPKLLSAHIYRERPYLFHTVRIISFILPLGLLCDALVGIIGYIDFAWTVGRYQVLFVVTLIGYLLLRGIVIDAMMFLSELFIRHVKNGWILTAVFLNPLDKIVRILLFILAVVVLFRLYELQKSAMVMSAISTFFSYSLFSLGSNVITPLIIIQLVIAIFVLYWFAHWSREFAYRWLYVRARDVGVRNSLAIFTQYVVVIIGFFLGLHLVGIDISGLTVVAAALFVGLGFGLRDIANNFVSGILLLIERPFRSGDIISLGEYEGEVINTGMRSLTIRTWDRMDVIVPNAQMFTQPFVNWTLQDSIVRCVILLRIDRADDPRFVQQVILDVLHRADFVLQDPEPQVLLKETQDWLMDMEVRFFLNLEINKSRAVVRSEALFAIYEAFKTKGVHAPMPKYDVALQRLTKTTNEASELE